MEKRILLIGGNFFPEPTGIGKFSGEMIQWFARNGYDCTVISTSPYYPHWKVQEPYSNKWFKKEQIKTAGKTVEIYRCPHYIPGKPSGMKRLLSEVSFSISSFFALLRIVNKKRFDYVITIAPPFQIGFHALLYKKLRNAKFLYHIQDLQIEAARDLGMIKSKQLINLLFRLEKNILSRADLISSISDGMLKKISAKINREVTFFPNWVDTDFFHPIIDHNVKEQFGFCRSDKIVLYSGAIGEKQGLEMIFASAKALINEKHIKFVICGSGPYKEKLAQLASDENLYNVHFLPIQPSEKFNSFLNMADVHLVIQKAHAADLVMPSKLTNILAVGGLALVTADGGTSLCDTICKYNIGLVSAPENIEDFLKVLLKSVTEDFTLIKENARNYAKAHLCIDKILTRYARKLDQLHPSFEMSKDTTLIHPTYQELL